MDELLASMWLGKYANMSQLMPAKGYGRNSDDDDNKEEKISFMSVFMVLVMIVIVLTSQ